MGELRPVTAAISHTRSIFYIIMRADTCDSVSVAAMHRQQWCISYSRKCLLVLHTDKSRCIGACFMNETHLWRRTVRLFSSV